LDRLHVELKGSTSERDFSVVRHARAGRLGRVAGVQRRFDGSVKHLRPRILLLAGLPGWRGQASGQYGKRATQNLKHGIYSLEMKKMGFGKQDRQVSAVGGRGRTWFLPYFHSDGSALFSTY
jgi:hypothetical protein